MVSRRIQLLICSARLLAGIAFLLFTVSACSWKTDKKQTTAAIDLYAGTKGDSHVFLGANVPYGRVRIGPQTASEGLPTPETGYNYNDTLITGFVVSYSPEENESLHINHQDDIRFIPTVKGETETPFVHSYEVVKPGYYSVYMHDADIAVELTATRNAAYQRYFYPPTDSAKVIIDRHLVLVNDTTATLKTPAAFYHICFSQPVNECIATDAPPRTTVRFDMSDEEMLYIKVGVSPKGYDEAERILQTELPGWNFERAIAEAIQGWNDVSVE